MNADSEFGAHTRAPYEIYTMDCCRLLHVVAFELCKVTVDGADVDLEVPASPGRWGEESHTGHSSLGT